MNFIEFVRSRGYGHTPSALSHLYYIDYLFTHNVVTPYDFNIIIGKPFGSSAYYYVWEKLGYIKPKKYHPGVKASEIDFVDYGEETLGNSLGFACGMLIGNNKKTWVNLSDAQLQMGPILEAIQFIGWNQYNIKLTIDYNTKQLTSNLMTNIISDTSLFRAYKWNVYEIADDQQFSLLRDGFATSQPTVFFIHTKKGDGVEEMENDPQFWHYRELEQEQFTLSDRLQSV